eukprot:6074682-Prymnesium_polylepis.1
MSAEDSIWDGLAARLRCPTCGGLMEDPYFLPCRHRFCKGCLDGAACAVCRTPYHELQARRNPQLGDFVLGARALVCSLDLASIAKENAHEQQPTSEEERLQLVERQLRAHELHIRSNAYGPLAGLLCMPPDEPPDIDGAP